MLVIAQIPRVIKDKHIMVGISKGIKVVIMKDMVEKEGIQRKKGLFVLIVELLAICR